MFIKFPEHIFSKISIAQSLTNLQGFRSQLVSISEILL
jgi:hypothetical protein